MRRLALCLPLLLLVPPASAAGPQVTDPAGDANGAGVAAPAPLSLSPYDITAVRWWADAAAQRVTVTFAEPPGDGRFVLTFATPTCDTVLLEWQTGGSTSYLAGCKPRHRRWPAAPVRSGRTLTFSIPRGSLPSWVAPGTALRKLGATAAPVQEARVLQLHPQADTAYADVRYVVGS